MIEWIEEPLVTLGRVGELPDTDRPAGRPFGAFVDMRQEAGFANDRSRHRYARDVIKAAFQRRRGRAPTLSEAQGAQVIALGETSYGRGWDNSVQRCPNGNCSGSNNWGAIIIRPCPPCPNGGALPSCPDGFVYRDSCPDGSPCYQCFRSYPSDTSGAEHLIKILYDNRPAVLEAASRGDLHGMAVAMRESGYYGLALEQYEKAMRRNLGIIADALGEPQALAQGGGSSAVSAAIPGAVAFVVGGVVALGALKVAGVL